MMTSIITVVVFALLTVLALTLWWPAWVIIGALYASLLIAFWITSPKRARNHRRTE